MRSLVIITLGLFLTVNVTASAQSEQTIPDDLVDFVTQNGECNITYKKDIQLQFLETQFRLNIPKSYIISDTSIDQRRGVSPPTGKRLKPLQSVLCLAVERDKVLVTSVDPNDRACGWVQKTDLAQLQQTDSTLAPCGEIQPLKVKAFCDITKSISNMSSATEKLTAGCNLQGVQDTAIDTKFITDNTTSRRRIDASNSALTMRKIPIFDAYDTERPSGTVDIFSVNKVFDAKSKNDGSLRILIGQGDKPRGWTDLDNGHIWYSTLTTYFNQNGRKSVYLQKIVDSSNGQNNQILAKKPSARSFDVKDDFVKFPVLFDMRQKDQMTPKRQLPQLEIAFIGKFCDGSSGQMCSSDDHQYRQGLSNLRAADVVFLIDGSKSMSEYFGLVAENLTRFTMDYIGNPDYRFGVAMYGDFQSKSKTNLGDPIDFKIIMDLEPNYIGNFDPIENADLLISDVMKDKPEAAHAAVFEAAKSFDWANNKPHFMIHIADHGDRDRPNKRVFNALLQNNIFYVPIAVEGEAILKESQTFIDDAKIYARNYTTGNGNPMAVNAIKSYGSGNINARESIAKALVEATGGWPDLGGSESDGEIMPVLDAAAKEIFNIPDGDDVQVLAATGYIETAPIGALERNWDYFVSLDLKAANDLKEDLATVCNTLGTGNSQKTIEETVFNMVRLLTGDTKPVGEMIEIWRQGAIPLQTETIIGSGIRNLLLAAATDQDLNPYKKEFCRSTLLIKLMQKNLKLKTGEENVDMTWEANSFEPIDPVKFNWRYMDLAGVERFYLPLHFLPRPLEK